MCNEEPKIKDDAVYNVTETCKILGICKDTLTDRRKRGLITPINPFNPRAFKYTGAAIRRLWRIENYLPI